MGLGKHSEAYLELLINDFFLLVQSLHFMLKLDGISCPGQVFCVLHPRFEFLHGCIKFRYVLVHLRLSGELGEVAACKLVKNVNLLRTDHSEESLQLMLSCFEHGDQHPIVLCQWSLSVGRFRASASSPLSPLLAFSSPTAISVANATTTITGTASGWFPGRTGF